MLNICDIANNIAPKFNPSPYARRDSIFNTAPITYPTENNILPTKKVYSIRYITTSP